MKLYRTVKYLDYDWLKVPIGTKVKSTEEWRPHEAFQFIALMELPNGILCPMFFDEVEEYPETVECDTCGSNGFSGYGTGYDSVRDDCGGSGEILLIDDSRKLLTKCCQAKREALTDGNGIPTKVYCESCERNDPEMDLVELPKVIARQNTLSPLGRRPTQGKGVPSWN